MVRRVVACTATGALVFTFALTSAGAASAGEIRADLAPAAKSPPTATAALETPRYTLPSWGDGQWGSSENYATIQLADLDGDGDQELLGRSSAGLESWDFDVTAGQWTPFVQVCDHANDDDCAMDWGDDAGWEAKQYYHSIGTADVDGDHADEVFSRTPNGFQVVKAQSGTDTSSPSWVAMTAADFATAAGWSDADSYTTLQGADLDGDGRDEIIGRGESGIDILSWDGSWSTTTLHAFTDAEGWTHPEYYTTIQTADLDADGRDEIFGRHHDGLVIWKYWDGAWAQITTSGTVFTDAEGWGSADHFATIQTADLDGDGDLEVFGRGTAGVQAYALTAITVAGKDVGWKWASCGVLDAFEGNAWSEPDRYRTIQAADVDGDGRDEVMGRHGDGMTVWGLQPSIKNCSQQKQNTNGWVNEQTVTGPAFTDALGWNEAQHFETIQAADIDGFTPAGSPGAQSNPRAELIGRGPTGIQTYRFDAKAGSWTSPTAEFPTWTGQAATAYEELSKQIAGDAACPQNQPCDIRPLYPSVDPETITDVWLPNLDLVDLSIPPAIWEDVSDQLSSELHWVRDVALAYDVGDDLINAISNAEIADRTAKHLWHRARTDEYNAEVVSVVSEALELLAGILDAASNAAGPELQVAMGVVDAVGSYAIADGGVSSSYAGTIDDFTGASHWVATWREHALAANTKSREAVMSDYGLLATVGTAYATGTWMVPDGDNKTKLIAAADRAYSTWLWQSLTPGMPAPCPDVNFCGGWVLGACVDGDQNHCLFAARGETFDLYGTACGAFACVYQEQGPIVGVDNRAYISSASKIPATLISQMTSATSEHCATVRWSDTCDLGQNAREIVVGLNGWSFQCSLYKPDAFPGQDAPESVCTPPGELRELYGSR